MQPHSRPDEHNSDLPDSVAPRMFLHLPFQGAIAFVTECLSLFTRHMFSLDHCRSRKRSSSPNVQPIIDSDPSSHTYNLIIHCVAPCLQAQFRSALLPALAKLEVCCENSPIALYPPLPLVVLVSLANRGATFPQRLRLWLLTLFIRSACVARCHSMPT